MTNNRALNRVCAIAVALGLMLVAVATASRASVQDSIHNLSIGFSQLEAVSLMPLDSMDFMDYRYQLAAPVDETPIGYSTLSKEAGQEPVRVYRLHKDSIDIADNLELPLSSGYMQMQVLEALEDKIPIMFYSNQRDGTGCVHCQAIVLMDLQSRELSLLGINSHQQEHQFELIVDKDDNWNVFAQNAFELRQSARLEEALTDDELAALSQRSGTDVQILEKTVHHAETDEREKDTDEPYQEDQGNIPEQEGQNENDENAIVEGENRSIGSSQLDATYAVKSGYTASVMHVTNLGIQFVSTHFDQAVDGEIPRDDSEIIHADNAAGTDWDPEPPGGDDMGSQPPGGDDSGAEPPGGDDIGAEPPGGDDSGAETPGGNDSGAGSPGGDDLAAKLPDNDRPNTEMPDDGAPNIDLPDTDPPDIDDADPENSHSDANNDNDLEYDIQMIYKAIVVDTQAGNPQWTEESETMALSVPGSGIALANYRLRMAYAFQQDLQGYNLIRNAEELDAVRTELDGKFRVVNDIDLTGYSSAYFTANNGWVGIGKNNRIQEGIQLRPFTGEFDGGGYRIRGLWCKYTGGEYNTRWHSDQGLFGFTEGAHIYDCHILLEREMTAQYQIAGLVGNANNGTVIENCSVTGGPVTVLDGGYAAGLVGRTNEAESHANNSKVIIRDCTVTGVDGKPFRTSGNYTGGLVGVAYKTDIISCLVENIETDVNSYGGGLIGGVHGESLVEDCHVKGMTSTARDRYAGGAFGCIYTVGDAGRPATQTVVKGCTVEDAVVAVQTNYSGGFAGVIYERSIVSDCAVKDVTVSANDASFAGGFAGVIYDRCAITRCSVENLDVSVNGSTSAFAGGFTGRLYNYATMTDCYAANGTVTSSQGSGGLAGAVADQAVVTNCYAQVDAVVTRSSGEAYAGGLVGSYNGDSSSSISNSYATGSVTANSGATSFVGGLIGRRINTAGALTNCYATGTVRVAPGSSYVGGLIGATGDTSGISNCYYDTTTTRRGYAIGGASVNTGTNPAGTTALTTTQMVAGTGIAGTYINFPYGDTLTADGNAGSPWYIDEEYTYPYLYYQYNGFSDEERNYNLAGVRYASGVHLGKLRKDFSIEDTMPFSVTSAGAQRAYFPYNGVSNYIISADTPTSVPSSAFAADTELYSLGGVSATNIVAFASMPQAIKSSDRPEYASAEPATYTYVGDAVMYQIEVINHSMEFDWHDVVLSDPLPTGVTLAETSPVTVQYGGAAEIPIQEGSGTTPYYAYNETTGTLSVFLGSLYIPDSAVGANTVIVRFATDIGEEALSEQPLVPGAEHIRNRGTVSGWMMVPDGGVPFDYETDFDDRNNDPVFTIRVTYDKNGAATGTEPVDPVLYRNGDEVIVLGREDLEWAGKLLLGWSPDQAADPADTQATIYAPGDTFHIGYDDVTLYAVWVDQVPLTFYKVDAKDTSVKLPDARFSLYQCADAGHADPADHGVPGNTVSCWLLLDDTLESDASGQFTVNAPTGGTLALVEDAAPYGYALPQGYWMFSANSDGTLTGPQGVGYVPGIAKAQDPQNPDVTWYLVTNISHMDLPLTGGNYLLIAIGVFCLLFGELSLRIARRREL